MRRFRAYGETVSHQCMTAEEWEGCADLCLSSPGERFCKALESCCWALMPQTWPVCFAEVGEATALEYLCRTVSGLKDLRVHTWNGNPIRIQCGRSQILHSNTRFATWYRWLFFLAMQGKQEVGFSGMWWFILSYFHCDALEGVCGCHIACKRTIKEETGDAVFSNLYHCLLSTFRLEMKVIKSSGGVPRLSYTGRDDRHFVPTGLYIVRTVNGRKRESPALHFFSLHFQVKSIWLGSLLL